MNVILNVDFYDLIFFLHNMLSTCNVCCIYSNPLQTIFFTEANTMKPKQTAPLNPGQTAPKDVTERSAVCHCGIPGHAH